MATYGSMKAEHVLPVYEERDSLRERCRKLEEALRECLDPNAPQIKWINARALLNEKE